MTSLMSRPGLWGAAQDNQGEETEADHKELCIHEEHATMEK